MTNNFVGFYFDAKCCSHSQDFFSKLKGIYYQSKQKQLNFEIVHVSADEDKKTCFDNYEKNHPDWFLWPFDNETKQ